MLRAIFKAIGWFIYSMLMLILGTISIVLNVFVGDQTLIYVGYACAACVILGVYKILSVKIKY